MSGGGPELQASVARRYVAVFGDEGVGLGIPAAPTSEPGPGRRHEQEREFGFESEELELAVVKAVETSVEEMDGAVDVAPELPEVALGIGLAEGCGVGLDIVVERPGDMGNLSGARHKADDGEILAHAVGGWKLDGGPGVEAAAEEFVPDVVFHTAGEHGSDGSIRRGGRRHVHAAARAREGEKPVAPDSVGAGGLGGSEERLEGVGLKKVVGIAMVDVAAPGSGEAGVASGRESAVAAVVQYPDIVVACRIVLDDRTDDGDAGVGCGVVDKNKLDAGSQGLLHERADAASDEGFHTVDGNDDADIDVGVSRGICHARNIGPAL